MCFEWVEEKTFRNLFRAGTGELSLLEKQKKDLARNVDLVEAPRRQPPSRFWNIFTGKNRQWNVIVLSGEEAVHFSPKRIHCSRGKWGLPVHELGFKTGSATDSCVSLGKLSPPQSSCFHLKIEGNTKTLSGVPWSSQILWSERENSHNCNV